MTGETNNVPVYSELFGFIPYLDSHPKTEWSSNHTENRITTLGFPLYEDRLREFVDVLYASNIIDCNYRETMESYGVESNNDAVRLAIPKADEELLRAMLTAVIRAERFCEGVLAEAAESGLLAELVIALKAITEKAI